MMGLSSGASQQPFSHPQNLSVCMCVGDKYTIISCPEKLMNRSGSYFDGHELTFQQN